MQKLRYSIFDFRVKMILHGFSPDNREKDFSALAFVYSGIIRNKKNCYATVLAGFLIGKHF